MRSENNMSIKEFSENIEKFFHFLFERFDFVVVYTFERSYPINLRIGLESNKFLNVRILFVHEWATSVMIGSRNAKFDEDLNWFSLSRIVDFLLKRPLRWPQDHIDMPYRKFLIMNLEEAAKELVKYGENIFAIFNEVKNFNQWTVEFNNYVNNDIHNRLGETKRP
jgi:hypothetical protein